MKQETNQTLIIIISIFIILLSTIILSNQIIDFSITLVQLLGGVTGIIGFGILGFNGFKRHKLDKKLEKQINLTNKRITQNEKKYQTELELTKKQLQITQSQLTEINQTLKEFKEQQLKQNAESNYQNQQFRTQIKR